jgi:hypothetical protein
VAGGMVEMGAKVDIEETQDSVMIGNGSSGPDNGQRRPALTRSLRQKACGVHYRSSLASGMGYWEVAASLQFELAWVGGVAHRQSLSVAAAQSKQRRSAGEEPRLEQRVRAA